MQHSGKQVPANAYPVSTMSTNAYKLIIRYQNSIIKCQNLIFFFILFFLVGVCIFYTHAHTRTFWTSDGTLERKSRNSLLSMAYGFRSFFVNLLMPVKKNQFELILTWDTMNASTSAKVVWANSQVRNECESLVFLFYTGHMLISQDENEEEKTHSAHYTLIYTWAPGIFNFHFKKSH